jgi:hypothetical protein
LNGSLEDPCKTGALQKILIQISSGGCPKIPIGTKSNRNLNFPMQFNFQWKKIIAMEN